MMGSFGFHFFSYPPEIQQLMNNHKSDHGADQDLIRQPDQGQDFEMENLFFRDFFAGPDQHDGIFGFSFSDDGFPGSQKLDF